MIFKAIRRLPGRYRYCYYVIANGGIGSGLWWGPYRTRAEAGNADIPSYVHAFRDTQVVRIRKDKVNVK